jgi:hypothetical protein
VVAEAASVRDALRGLLGRVRALLGIARRQRQEQRVVRATLATLKKLKTPG